MGKVPVYLDNAATTQTAPEVSAAMDEADSLYFYNSSALYAGAGEAAKRIAAAKRLIKRRLGGENGELHFVSGATEANNTVILGKIRKQAHGLVIAEGEHSSVHSPAVYLEQTGFTVKYAPLLPTGEVDIDAAADLITPDTALFAFGLVNSDTGTVQPAAEIIGRIRAKNPKTHIHCDAVQGFCKFDFHAEQLGFDSVTISAHKINGPKGIGALWVRKGVTVPPLLYGGGHTLRPGTEANALIAGFARAVEIFDTAANFARVSGLHRRLLDNLPKNCAVNGINNNPYITSIQLPVGNPAYKQDGSAQGGAGGGTGAAAVTDRTAIPGKPYRGSGAGGIMWQTVLNALNARGIFVGLGSACSSNSAVNRTLRAMGRTPAQQKQVIRVSFGTRNTAEEVDLFIKELNEILASY